MMLKTYLGVIEDESGLHYLRPETAQGIFVNFANVVQTSRKKPPFGIGQVGKSFRNEITPGNFIFRTREFEQMEMEFFVVPGTDEEWHQYWIDERTRWYTDLGHRRPTTCGTSSTRKEKLSHYSKRTVDIEYRFGFTGSEWGELEGIANRTDFDLSTHTKHSGTDLSYFDQASGERFVPYVIEPAAGLTRSLMAFLIEAYVEDEAPNTKGGVDKRTVLRLDPRLAPVKVAVLPLSRNEALSPKARDLAAELRKYWNVDFDDAQAIGRRYRRQDEIGTPFCITVDFDTLEDDAVTIRERDTMSQERVVAGQGHRLSGVAAARLLTGTVMTARYNPPPNWPQPPAGWVPPPAGAGSALGPAAAGWPLWVEDVVPAPVHQPTSPPGTAVVRLPTRGQGPDLHLLPASGLPVPGQRPVRRAVAPAPGGEDLHGSRFDPAGADFEAHIRRGDRGLRPRPGADRRQLAGSRVSDGSGRRIDRHDDFVRLEIESALASPRGAGRPGVGGGRPDAGTERAPPEHPRLTRFNAVRVRRSALDRRPESAGRTPFRRC